jgi:hypothetical protein
MDQNSQDYSVPDPSEEAEIARRLSTREEGLVYSDSADEVGFDDLDDPATIAREFGIG